MENFKACAIIFNKNGDLLLQKRDEEPEIGKWVLFGGGIEAGETDEAALRREIKEELEYELKNIRFFGRYKGGGMDLAVFIVKDPVEPSELVLHEGFGMEFFPPAAIEGLAIGFNFKQILQDYLKSKS